MHEYTVVVRWPQATERIFLGDLFSLRKGTQIITVELWPKVETLTRYVTSIKAVGILNGKCTVRILYKRDENSGQALENDAWGISELIIDTDERTVIASWHDDRPNGEFDTPGRAKLIIERDNIEIKRSKVLRIDRMQSRLRNNLLVLDQCCVVSGETTKCVLEAAHIVEVKGNGGHAVGNGLLLRADLHRLFDERLLTIDSKGIIKFKGQAKSSPDYGDQKKEWRLPSAVLDRVRRRLMERNSSDA